MTEQEFEIARVRHRIMEKVKKDVASIRSYIGVEQREPTLYSTGQNSTILVKYKVGLW